MAIADVEKRLFDYISDSFLTAIPNVKITPQTSLLGSRIIDSLGILEMIEFLEREFDISVEETEMIPENLDSIDNMSRFIMKKIEV